MNLTKKYFNGYLKSKMPGVNIEFYDEDSSLSQACCIQRNRLARRRRDAENSKEMSENDIGTQVIEAAINVHRELGPGLLETVYEIILARELSDLGFKVERQVSIPVLYKGIRFEEGFRADIIVEKKVQTYLRLTGLKLGYLLNFGGAILKNGITRCVNGLEE